MAALIVRSPTTLLWSQGTSKPSPAEDRLKPTHVRYPKRIGYFPALALSLSKNSDSIFHGSFLPRVAYQVGMILYMFIVDEFECVGLINCEDLIELMLHSIQALHYAYSESVVKKLYPNYEAEPCQQYDK